VFIGNNYNYLNLLEQFTCVYERWISWCQSRCTQQLQEIPTGKSKPNQACLTVSSKNIGFFCRYVPFKCWGSIFVLWNV